MRNKSRTSDHFLSMTTRATPTSVRQVLARIDCELQGRGLNSETRSDAQIVLAEVLNNITEHAYGATGTGSIDCRLAAAPDRLVIRVEDEGREMPGRQLPMATLPDVKTALGELPEGGYGWYLVHRLTEELSYRRDSGRNILTFSIALAT